MIKRVLFVIPILLAMSIAIPPAGATGLISSSVFAQAAPDDFDGDGLLNIVDPDDDNDGILDDADEDPFDPLIPANPPPPADDPLASDQDSDGDGLVNVVDPDDNNNGSTDEDELTAGTTPTAEPVVSPTATEPVPLIPANPPVAPVVPANPPVVPTELQASQPEQVAPAPAVTSLPNTGSGDGSTLSWIGVLGGVTVMAGVLAAFRIYHPDKR